MSTLPLQVVLFSCYPEPLWIFDLSTTRFLAVNEAALALYGYTRDEILSMTLADIRPAEDLPLLQARLNALPSGPAKSGPWRHRKRDGSLFWVEIDAHTIEYEGRRARLTIMRDVTDQQHLAAVLQSERDFSAAVLDTVGALVVVLDTEGRIVRFNKTCEAVTGYAASEVLGQDCGELLLPPDELAGAREAFERQGALNRPGTHENDWVCKDGTRHRVAWTNTVLKNDAGEVEFFIGTGISVTERRRVEAALRVAERSYQSIFENALEGIFQTTPEGKYLAANPALARIYGYDSPDDLLAHLTDIRCQLYVDALAHERFAALMQEQGVVHDFEARIIRKDGTTIWIAERAHAVRGPDGALLYYEGTVQDITDRKTLEAERETLLAQTEMLLTEAVERADRDPLTGLLNHRAFHKKLEEEADRAQRTGEPLTVAVMDLDNFKFFNDAYGHAAGDDVLHQVASALHSVCRSYDTLARFGGDEFALLMPGTAADKGAALAQRLTDCLVQIGYRPPGYDTTIPLGLSLGLATFPEDAPTRHEALHLADARLLRAKAGEGENDAAATLRASLSSSVPSFSMLDALVTAVDNKDRYTRHHSEDVLTLCLGIARELGISEADQHTLTVAALLHDVGKVGVPDRILRKPGHLTDEEAQAVQQHPMMGAVIVGAVAGLEHTLDCVRHHHERWDGKGYPLGLIGEQIPLLARVMAVADAYSAITTDRPYRQGKSAEDALAILADGAGTQWDPVCVEAMSRFYRAKIADCTARQE